MSSILNALKKLDREPAEKVEIQPLAQTLDTTRVFRKPRQQQRFLRSLYLVALVVTIGAGGMLLSHLWLNNPVMEKNVPASGKVGEKALPPNTSGREIVTPGGLETGNPLAVAPEKLEERKVAAIGTVDQDTVRHRDETPVGKEQAPTKTTDETGSSATRIDIAPTAAGRDAIGPSAKVANEQEPQQGHKLSRLDYSVLRLQAVTWAVDPRDRFALVDNAILRKGESVKGFVVDSIHEDHIVVRKGGERWRVEFRLR